MIGGRIQFPQGCWSEELTYSMAVVQWPPQLLVTCVLPCAVHNMQDGFPQGASKRVREVPKVEATIF